MVRAIDSKRRLEKLAELLYKLDEGLIDVGGFASGVSKETIKNLLEIALEGESEKNRLDATKHLLGLAGHTVAQKHEVSRVDPNTPKESLIAMIKGSDKDLAKAGIEIVDDDNQDPRE